MSVLLIMTSTTNLYALVSKIDDKRSDHCQQRAHHANGLSAHTAYTAGTLHSARSASVCVLCVCVVSDLAVLCGDDDDSFWPNAHRVLCCYERKKPANLTWFCEANKMQARRQAYIRELEPNNNKVYIQIGTAGTVRYNVLLWNPK